MGSFDSFGANGRDDADEDRYGGDDDYRAASSEFGDVDLLPPPRDEMTSGHLLRDDWEDGNDDGWRGAADGSEYGRKGARREHPLNKFRTSSKKNNNNNNNKKAKSGTGDLRQSALADERTGRRHRVKIVTTTARPTVNTVSS